MQTKNIQKHVHVQTVAEAFRSGVGLSVIAL